MAHNLKHNLIFRKRKNYFDCQEYQKNYNKKLILNQSKEFSEFTKSIGLKISKIILAPDQDEELNHETKISILSDNFTEQNAIFQYLRAKDLALLSNFQYLLQRKALIGIHKMPSIGKISKLQHKLNNFFEIKKNQNGVGYFSLPQPKIKYVCENFLLKNQEKTYRKFRIKLNIDSTSITSTNLILLNISFNFICH